MANATDQVEQALNAHAEAIDALHHKLAGMPGMNQAKLQQCVETYKAAHQAFHDDALGCMN
jgi:uncharacterized protein (DUF3084 family)